MRLKSLRIEGWRSFSPGAPVELRDLGPVTVLIGPNNAGKSNIARFLSWLCQLLADATKNGSSYHRPILLTREIKEVERWMRGQEQIRAELVVEAPTISSPAKGPMTAPDGTVRIACTATYDPGHWSVQLQPIAPSGEPFFENDRAHPSVWSDSGYVGSDQAEPEYLSFALLVCQALLDALLIVPAIRSQDERFGSAVLERLRPLSEDDNRASEWTAIKRDLRAWLGRLLDEKVIALELTKEGVRVTTEKGGVEFPCLLRDLGDGVGQLFFILAHLRLSGDVPSIVAIDEPEAHLHPGAVVELLRLLQEEFPSVQLIAATHSPTVVDALSPTWRMHRVLSGADGATQVDVVENQTERLALLDMMGVTPSQVFLTRTVIWVEGPSDITYIRALLREVDPDLVYGREYSFAMFGGSSGKHLSFEEDDERLVQLLQLGHRNILVHDKDSASPTATAHALVSRWTQELTNDPARGAAFQTWGREVENLVKPEVLYEHAKAVQSYMQDRGRRRDLVFPPALPIAEGDQFDVVVSDAAEFQGGQSLDSTQRDRLRKRLNDAKAELARVIVAEHGSAAFRSEALDWARDVAASIRK